MEFVTGTAKKERAELAAILAGELDEKQVTVNGIVHTVRAMGEVVFVILRKRDGLLQCVLEMKETDVDVKLIREAAAVEVSGVIRREERAPGGLR